MHIWWQKIFGSGCLRYFYQNSCENVSSCYECQWLVESVAYAKYISVSKVLTVYVQPKCNNYYSMYWINFHKINTLIGIICKNLNIFSIAKSVVYNYDIYRQSLTAIIVLRIQVNSILKQVETAKLAFSYVERNAFLFFS